MKTKCYSLNSKLILVFLFASRISVAQTSTEIEQIVSSYNQNKLLQLQAEYSQKEEDARQKAYTMAAENGWDNIQYRQYI